MKLNGKVFGFAKRNLSGAQRKKDASSGQRGARKGGRPCPASAHRTPERDQRSDLCPLVRKRAKQRRPRTLDLRHLRTSGPERPRHPIRVWEPARGDCIDFSFDIVFDPADRWRAVINQQKRSAGIAIKRLADTPCVDHRKLGYVPHERLVNVSVDGDRLPERQIRRFEFRISCVRDWRTPGACGTSVHKRYRRMNDNAR